MPADPNRVILTGENPFIRLSQTDGGPNTTNASFWRIITCPAGPGHVLYLNSELTENRWRIYSDNIAMARWLQSTVQGMLNAETADAGDPCARCRVLRNRATRAISGRRRGSTRRGDCAHLVSDRRSVADPHAAQCGARSSPLWRVHPSHTRSRRAPYAQRRRGGGPAMAERARRATLQHLRAGVLRKLDRTPLAAFRVRPDHLPRPAGGAR